MSVTSRPDALMLPKAMKQGARFRDRVYWISDIAEAILGGKPFIYTPMRGDKIFVTLTPYDLLLFADGPRRGQSRYRWEQRPDGSVWGWLVEGADDAR